MSQTLCSAAFFESIYECSATFYTVCMKGCFIMPHLIRLVVQQSFAYYSYLCFLSFMNGNYQTVNHNLL